MESRACAPSAQHPSACSPWYEGSGRLKTSRIGCAMSRSMKTTHRCAVVIFPKSWQRYATPRLVCSGTLAIRTLRRRAVGWLPSRYKRWLSSGLNWKTKWPCEGGREVETESWQQAATLEHLEPHHLGITQVRRDQYGTIIAEPEDTSIETLLQELRGEVTRGEATLNAP